MIPPELDARVLAVARAVRARGGRALVVGGAVRDWLLERPSKDVDVEVLGLDAETLHAVLADGAEVVAVGRSFGVFRRKGLDVDFSLPRDHSAQGEAIAVEGDPSLDFEAAARRRDLTVNAIGYDPLSDEVLDPFDGRTDLAARRLRAVDAIRFGDDPLRGLRVAQLGARFEMQPDAELLALCRELDLTDVSAERIFEEMRKLLLRARRPSLGLDVLRETDLLKVLPELATQLAGAGEAAFAGLRARIDATAERSLEAPEAIRTALMFAALCCDLGVEPARALLERLRAPAVLVTRVTALVGARGAPRGLADADDACFRRLARTLARARTDLATLVALATGDGLSEEVATELRARAATLGVLDGARPPAVQGRDLLARGRAPGPQIGVLLERCLALQDATGVEDREWLIAQLEN